MQKNKFLTWIKTTILSQGLKLKTFNANQNFKVYCCLVDFV